MDPVTPKPDAPAAPQNASNVLNTYEDCAALITSSLPTASEHEPALKQLLKFFETRISKKSARDEKEGAGAVKRAIEGKRTFKQWKPSEPKQNETPGGGLFTA